MKSHCKEQCVHGSAEAVNWSPENTQPPRKTAENALALLFFLVNACSDLFSVTHVQIDDMAFNILHDCKQQSTGSHVLLSAVFPEWPAFKLLPRSSATVTRKLYPSFQLQSPRSSILSLQPQSPGSCIPMAPAHLVPIGSAFLLAMF